jgi:uncharacterized protein (TIGR03437 family)
MQGVTAAINGRAAPLYFVSPSQLNIQVPYETPAGTATVTVTVNGESASQQLLVSSTAPGIYTSDGRNVVPMNQVTRGGTGVLYITGQGGLIPAISNGAAPDPGTPVEKLPSPIASIAVTVGGVPARVMFSANPYFLVGVTQINYQVAEGTPTGVQPVIVRAGANLSPAAYIYVQ